MTSPDVLRFTVFGEPTPKERARSRVITPKSGKAFATHFTPAATRAYEARVRLFCQQAVAGVRWMWTDRDRFALHVAVFRTHEGIGGDVDNYVKAIADSINGIAFRDDRYIRSIAATLFQDAARPRVEVEVHRFRIGERMKEVSNG